MRAAVVEAVRTVTVREVGEPEPRGRAIVEVTRAGICGTDLKIVDGAIPVAYPRVLGHEIVGTVVQAGAPGGEALVATGARVLVDPAVACGVCHLCRADREHLCPRGALLGRDADGGFAQLVAVDERRLHPLPDGIGDAEAPVLQVLGTCVHAQTLIDVFPGQVGVVVGLGVSGLLHLQLLRARGLTTVVGIGRSPAKRELAAHLGATATATPDEAARTVADLTGGRGADVVVESVGTVPTLRQAIEVSGLGATVLLFGTITDTGGQLPFYELYYKELDIQSSRAARPRDYARAIDLVASGAVRVADLITSSFPLSDVAAALEACERGRDQLKVTLDIS